MKRFIPFFLAVLFLLSEVSWGQIFNQDFSSSSTVSDYVNSSSPTSGQWNAIGSSGAGVTSAIINNALVFTRTTANTGSFSRITDFSPTPTGIIYSLVIAVSGNTAAQTSAAVIQIGSNFGTANSAETIADVYARFGINLTAIDGTYTIRDIGDGTNSSNLSGSQTIVWYLNNTGSQVTYTGPNGVSETVENDTWDLWAGTTIIFNDKAATTTTQSTTDLKFAFTAGSGSIILDNFIIHGATDGSLPVELTSFTASNVNNGVQLNWQTETEVNNYGFNIERASTPLGMTWEKIGFVQGHGNSNSPKSYSFTDNLALTHDLNLNRLQYRLKQIDFDGKFEYSKIVEVNVEVPTAFVLHQNSPNPFNPTTEIKFALPKNSNVELSIYNLLGEKVQTLANGMMNAGEHKVSFNASNLSSGVYLYKLTTDGKASVRKMILMK